MITGLRKFIFSLIVFAVASLLVWFGKITGGEYVSITIADIAIFTTGNVISGVGGRVAEKMTVEVKPTQEVK